MLYQSLLPERIIRRLTTNVRALPSTCVLPSLPLTFGRQRARANLAGFPSNKPYLYESPIYLPVSGQYAYILQNFRPVKDVNELTARTVYDQDITTGWILPIFSSRHLCLP